MSDTHLHHLPSIAMAFGLLGAGHEPAGAQDARVTVTPSEVRVTIPVTSSAFHWNVPATPDEALEYEWQVAVASGDRRHSFGFSLFKRAQAEPRTEDLAALLRAGQVTVWLVTDSGGSALTGWDITAVARPQAVEIVVRGADAIKTLFGTLPATVSVHSLTPAGCAAQRVPVEYLGGRPPG